MKRIYLFCSAGMSTSMLASNMQKVANEHNLPVEILAFPIGKMEDTVKQFHPDCILLGPQVKFMLKEVDAKFGKEAPVSVIDASDYGNMNGEKVLKSAIKLIKEKK
ncbi:MAG: PTS sugar transporter subunit IIB [Erysipelotrichaceae bacterium]